MTANTTAASTVNEVPHDRASSSFQPEKMMAVHVAVPPHPDLFFDTSLFGTVGKLTSVGTVASQRKADCKPVFSLRYAPEKTSRFRALQKWRGYVLEISNDSFTARTEDLSGKSPEEEVVFSQEEIPPADLALLHEGAIFYWMIGYRDSRGGQRSRTSEIRFRRLPLWNQEELDEARARAVALREEIAWE